MRINSANFEMAAQSHSNQGGQGAQGQGQQTNPSGRSSKSKAHNRFKTIQDPTPKGHIIYIETGSGRRGSQPSYHRGFSQSVLNKTIDAYDKKFDFVADCLYKIHDRLNKGNERKHSLLKNRR